MIIDLNSFIGTWPSHAIEGQPDKVWSQLRALGVKRIFASALETCWGRNPHAFNGRVYEAAFQVGDVYPVPVIDPTVVTWKRELDQALLQAQVLVVRLLPNYHIYDLNDVCEMLKAIDDAGLGVNIQVCMEDPRRHHPLAQVSNVPISHVLDVVESMPDLRVVIGGGKASEIRQATEPLLALPNVYVDTSQIDGLDAVRVLVDEGLGDRLVFGSHAPLFVPYTAFSRVITDLDDETATAILSGNALRLLGET